jgi:hypothetical protein
MGILRKLANLIGPHRVEPLRNPHVPQAILGTLFQMERDQHEAKGKALARNPFADDIMQNRRNLGWEE